MPGLAQLIIDLSLNSAKFVSGIDQANKSLTGMKKNIETIKIASLTYLAREVGNAVQQFYAFGKSIASVANDIQRQAGIVGISTTEWQKWTYAAKMADASTEDLMTGFRFLSQRIIDAKKEGSEANQIFKALGITETELIPVALQLADKFSKSADGAGKMDVAVKLLGRGALNLIPFFNLGSSAIKGFGEEAVKMGTILGDVVIKKGSEAEDVFKKLDSRFNSLKISLSPIVLEFVKLAESIAKAIQELIKWREESKKSPITVESIESERKAKKQYPWAWPAEEKRDFGLWRDPWGREPSTAKGGIPSIAGKAGIWDQYGVSEEEYNRIKESHERIKRDVKEWIEEYNQMGTELAKPWPPAEEGFEWVKGISDKTKESIKEIETMIEKLKDFRDTGISQTIIPMPPAIDLDYFHETAEEQERINKNIREEISLLEKLAARNRASRDDQKRLNDLKELQVTYQRDIGELTGGITAYYSKLGLYAFDPYEAIDKRIEELKKKMAEFGEEKWEIKPTSETLLKWGQEAAAAKYGKYTGFEWSPEDKDMEGYVVIGDQTFKLDDLIKYQDLIEEIRQQRLSVPAEDNWQYWERITPLMGLTTEQKGVMEKLAEDEKQAKFWGDQVSNGLNIMGDAIRNLEQGWKGFFQTMTMGFTRLIQEIMMAIVKAQILAALPKSMGGGGAGLGSLFGFLGGGTTPTTPTTPAEPWSTSSTPFPVSTPKSAPITYVFIRAIDTQSFAEAQRRAGATVTIIDDHLQDRGRLVDTIRSVQ